MRNRVFATFSLWGGDVYVVITDVEITGKSNEQYTALRLLPKDLSNVRLAEPKPRKFMTHEALSSSSTTQGRLALVPADNSVINLDLDLNRILQRTTMAMKAYPTATESPKEMAEDNEILEFASGQATLQQLPSKSSQQLQQQLPPSTLPPNILPKASQLPRSLNCLRSLKPPFL
ncbi:hypothetical protein L596_011420 [Steinernema carpocapsae]|uniref:Uncharacterized protein n=1 Tax=Steinernema carpocapsae TaxID=34508 RepID=A0A4U5NUR0_STECR|nr:hypothetical protein L596_011420 [Steinernema carpocapsae]